MSMSADRRNKITDFHFRTSDSQISGSAISSHKIIQLKTVRKSVLIYETIIVIIGYRADDSYFSYARDFISGVISYEQLGKAMQLGSLGEQYCLKTEKAFQHLKFIAKEHVPSAEWYSKKMLRDRNARNGYKDMEKETYHRGELYISRIIDEEMKSDDLFLR